MRNYDIGHLSLGADGGGLAAAGVGDVIKAEGCTGQVSPTGDAWGSTSSRTRQGTSCADHTWNGTSGNCTDDNRADASAVEPGSESTIMGYAGICDDDNLQPHSDSYFSQRSQGQMYGWVDAPASAEKTRRSRRCSACR